MLTRRRLSNTSLQTVGKISIKDFVLKSFAAEDVEKSDTYGETESDLPTFLTALSLCDDNELTYGETRSLVYLLLAT